MRRTNLEAGSLNDFVVGCEAQGVQLINELVLPERYPGLFTEGVATSTLCLAVIRTGMQGTENPGAPLADKPLDAEKFAGENSDSLVSALATIVATSVVPDKTPGLFRFRQGRLSRAHDVSVEEYRSGSPKTELCFEEWLDKAVQGQAVTGNIFVGSEGQPIAIGTGEGPDSLLLDDVVVYTGHPSRGGVRLPAGMWVNLKVSEPLMDLIRPPSGVSVRHARSIGAVALVRPSAFMMLTPAEQKKHLGGVESPEGGFKTLPQIEDLAMEAAKRAAT